MESEFNPGTPTEHTAFLKSIDGAIIGTIVNILFHVNNKVKYTLLRVLTLKEEIFQKRLVVPNLANHLESIKVNTQVQLQTY